MRCRASWKGPTQSVTITKRHERQVGGRLELFELPATPGPRQLAVLSPVIPASTSATCRTCSGVPSRCSRPAILSRQPRSPASTVSAPLATISRTLAETMRDRNLRIFHAEGAAEAAADFRIRHLCDGCADRLQKFARLFLDAQFAQARTTVVISDSPPAYLPGSCSTPKHR